MAYQAANPAFATQSCAQKLWAYESMAQTGARFMAVAKVASTASCASWPLTASDCGGQYERKNWELMIAGEPRRMLLDFSCSCQAQLGYGAVTDIMYLTLLKRGTVGMACAAAIELAAWPTQAPLKTVGHLATQHREASSHGYTSVNKVRPINTVLVSATRCTEHVTRIGTACRHVVHQALLHGTLIRSHALATTPEFHGAPQEPSLILQFPESRFCTNCATRGSQLGKTGFRKDESLSRRHQEFTNQRTESHIELVIAESLQGTARPQNLGERAKECC